MELGLPGVEPSGNAESTESIKPLGNTALLGPVEHRLDELAGPDLRSWPSDHALSDVGLPSYPAVAAGRPASSRRMAFSTRPYNGTNNMTLMATLIT